MVVAANASFEGSLEGRTPIDASNSEIRRLTVFWVRKEFDYWTGKVVVVCRVVVVVCYRKGAKGAEVEG